MEDVRIYRREDDDDWTVPDDERIEFDARRDEEVPFHIPRD